MSQIPCDVVQEYEVPPGVTAVRIEAETSAVGRHSSSAVTLQMAPGAILRLRFTCLQAPVEGLGHSAASANSGSSTSG
jgi:hypothetical protein